jgi:hypothetical protein
MAACRSCEAPVIWAETTTGKKMPLDARPTAKGNLVFLAGVARGATDEDRRLKRPLYTSHFATCPDAATFRRR